MSIPLAVIVPTHNPRADYLQAALAALKAQTLAPTEWELIVVDNRSDPPLSGRLDLAWHPRAAVEREAALGLARARLAGIRRADSEMLVFVDDDNVLAADYLDRAARIGREFPLLGTWGGQIQPRYEDPRLAVPKSLAALLTLRTASGDSWSNDCDHHRSTPWGAGLCVRRAVAARYADELGSAPERLRLDLQGPRLLYGGDTDIAYTACRMGLGKGVFERLRLEHLIPASRCTAAYLCRVAEGRGYSEVLHHLTLRGVLPPPEKSALDRIRRLRRALAASRLERRVWRAHLAGRDRALRELGAPRSS